MTTDTDITRLDNISAVERAHERNARSLAIGTFSDLYKEIHGIRPRWVNTEVMSLSELMSCINDLNEELQSEQDYWDYMATQDALDAEEEARQAEAAVAAREDAVWSIQDALEGIR